MSVQNTAISGLQAAAIDLEVSGNNIANANTYGFKQGRTEFADMFYTGRAGAQIGNGVQVSAINQEFSTVGYTITGGNYDLATNSDGFFVTRSTLTNGTNYTRAGNFRMDKDGKLVTQNGEVVQGYLASNNQITASLGDLRIPFNQVTSPKATGNISLDLNLDASETAISLPFSPTDNNTYNSKTSINIFDSLGSGHILDTYFTKTIDNSWSVQVEVDGNNIGNGDLNFDNTGKLINVTGLNGLTFNPGGGALPGQAINFDFSSTSQYGSSSAVRGLSADGFATGMPGGVSIDQNGVIEISYSNGENVIVGQVALAKFENPQGLQTVGNTAWTATSASGAALLSAGNSQNAIRAGTLENSNVDLTEQLVKLISAQRNYQANAQSIRAGDMILQTIINIE